MLQADSPDPLEEARPNPGLEAQVASTAGTVLGWNHFPLTAGSQHVKNTVEGGPVGNPWPTVGSERFVGRPDRFDQVPQVIGNLAESIPLLGFWAHHQVLHDFTMFVSALTGRKHEGF